MVIVVVARKASDVPREPIDGKPTVVYWDIVALAQMIRLALAAAKVDFVDVQIELDDPKQPGYKDSWLDSKPHLPLEFPNLPYFMDNKVKLSQSNTILRYIGKKYNMYGPKEHLTDLVLDELKDLEFSILKCGYILGPEAALSWYKDEAPTALKQFKSLLSYQPGDSAASTSDELPGFLHGAAKPSVADIKLYVWLYKLTVIQAQLGTEETAHIVEQKWIQDFMKLIESLEGVAEYIASPQYMKSPLHAPNAKWQG